MTGPLWTDWVTAIFTAVTALVLLGTAFAAVRQLRETRKTRHGQLIMELTARWYEENLREARLALAKMPPSAVNDLIERMYQRKPDPGDEDTYYRIIPLPALIEVIGSMEAKDVGLTLEQVNDLWGGAILGYWEKWKAAVLYMRNQRNSEHAYENFGDLAIKLHKLRHPQPDPPRYGGIMAPGGRYSY